MQKFYTSDIILTTCYILHKAIAPNFNLKG